MNEHFVSIKVDREERPDLDAVYMEAVVALSGHGGWPMTVFLTPEGEPFYGGTYYPPEPRHGLPSFRQVLDAVAEAWRERRDDVTTRRRAARRGRAALDLAAAVEGAADGRAAVERRARAAEPVRPAGTAAGGGAPKFPNAPALEFLLRRGDDEALAMVATTLDGMAAGGMYDLLGGGFHRYSVDDRWLVPHFEKMLYDNALLAPAYLHGWLVTGNERYREICRATIEYMLRELALPEGGFASAQDADTDGVEGLTFTWTEEEGVPAELLEPFEHGRSILRGELDARAARAALRAARDEAEAAARRQGDRVLERARAGGARRGGAEARRAGLDRRRRSAGRVPARPALRQDGPPAAQLPRGPHERRGLPRRLRERRARPARAARRDRRAALARGGEPARAARGRALRRRGARRLLPGGSLSRSTNCKDQGAR